MQRHIAPPEREAPDAIIMPARHLDVFELIMRYHFIRGLIKQRYVVYSSGPWHSWIDRGPHYLGIGNAVGIV